jgi:hypothetical protein
MIDKPSSTDRTARRRVSPRVLTWWFGLMAIGGLIFGAVADRRPFGNDLLGHPLVVLFGAVGAGLLVLRFALARPVPEVIPERSLFVGCVIALVAFLAGNWFGVHLAAMP